MTPVDIRSFRRPFEEPASTDTDAPVSGDSERSESSGPPPRGGLIPPAFLVCVACGAVPPLLLPPHCCPKEDATDPHHVLLKEVDARRVRFPELGPENPFLRYRDLLHAYHFARTQGRTDAEYTEVLRDLEEALVLSGEQGPRTTPFERMGELSQACGSSQRGGVWVKDESHQVFGTFDFRSLFGSALYTANANSRPASIDVPRDSGTAIGELLADAVNAAYALRSTEVDSARPPSNSTPSESSPDPYTVILSDRIPENGMAIDGATTIGYEIAVQMKRARVDLDRILIPAIAGELAAAVGLGLRQAVQLGCIARLPRIQIVESESCYPMARAYETFLHRVLSRVHEELISEPVWSSMRKYPRVRAHLADTLLHRLQAVAETTDDPTRSGTSVTPVRKMIEQELGFATRNRAEFMREWCATDESPNPPIDSAFESTSVDLWFPILRSMVESAGFPVLIDRAQLDAAKTLLELQFGRDANPMAALGLAGVVHLRDSGDLAPDENVAVVLPSR